MCDCHGRTQQKDHELPVVADDGSHRTQARAAAAVVLAAVVLWVGLSWLGGELGFSGRYAFLINFGALAAFFWSYVVVVRVWRKSRLSGG